jgi:predicted AAA+ superfamily ATPase
VEKMTTRVSSNGIAEENGIGSHNTVSSYLDALENSFVLNVFYQVALDDRLPSYRKDSKKVYVTDPFIYHALRGWVKGDADYYRSARDAVMDKVERSRIVEMVVGDHLIRCSYGMSLSDLFSHHEHVFHHRSKRSDREVDFVLRDGKALLPVEVKYQGSVSTGDLRNLYPLGHGVVVTGKDMWTHRTYSALPAELFLMLI